MPVITPSSGTAFQAIPPESLTAQDSGTPQHRIDSAQVRSTESASEFAELQWQIDATAAIAELMSKIASARRLDEAHLIVANALREFLGADVVAVGTVNPGSSLVRVRSVSDVSSIDESSQVSQQFEQAMSESIVRFREQLARTTVVDPDSEHVALMQLAHERLLSVTGTQCAVSCPLFSQLGPQQTPSDPEHRELSATQSDPVAVWTALFRQRPTELDRWKYFANACQQPLGESLAVAGRACEGPLARLRRVVSESSAWTRKKMVLGGSLAIALAMTIPIPHRVGCVSVLQPVEQRFAVAPHDGILEQAMVRAGEQVHTGQLLAEMDATDLRLQIADVTAQKERAEKKRDLHRASGDAASTQLAELETDELAAQLALLEHRAAHRQIVSSIDGIVLRSELDEARGVPVRTGDVLMQVAPLETLRAELEIAPADLAHIKLGQTVSLVPDGNPLHRVQGTIDTIRQASEVREGRNVFLATVTIDNHDGRLRPGMKSRTKVDAGYRASGWVLFHSAIEKTYGMLR
ncbi:efflux RND transporter periplasmic adaptor subunit [Rhodopirellula islandica]|nr:HlyD family efflux transporter periplasmic adaptor subunit [Rhodopirellula islandica]